MALYFVSLQCLDITLLVQSIQAARKHVYLFSVLTAPCWCSQCRQHAGIWIAPKSFSERIHMRNGQTCVQVRTYDVVPITPSLGMVAFVAGTTPLKALLTDPTLIPGEAIAAADEKYSRFIMAKGGNLERAGLPALLHFVTL